MYVNRVSAVTFDVFGTLIEFKSTFDVRKCYKASYDIFISKGLNLGSFDEFYKACLREWFKVLEKRFTSGKDTAREVFYFYVLKRFGYDFNPNSSIILEAIYGFYKVFASEIKFSKETLEKMKMLKKRVKIGIISDFVYPPSLREILKKTGLEKVADCIIISSEIGWAKPSLQIFNAALKCLDVNPKYVVHVGDRLDSDIFGAKRLGMKTIWIRRTVHPDEPLNSVRLKAKPDFEADNIDDAFSILFKIV
ncbi:MAG: HAD family hydrolase [Candidatus Baldrarchaeia archaeon]|mgnify:CR=1 FL=1